MKKTLVIGVLLGYAVVFGATIGLAAHAAEGLSPASPPGVTQPLITGRSLANAPYLSSTGETVPRPGQAAPSGAQTGGDRQIHDRNDRLINKGICSNC